MAPRSSRSSSCARAALVVAASALFLNLLGHGPRATADDSSCSTTIDAPNVTRNGNDFASVQLLDTDTIDDCAALCCFTSNCAAFSFNRPQPEPVCVTPASCCAVNGTCCMLKNALPPATNNTYGPVVQTGFVGRAVVPGPTPPFPLSSLVLNVTFSEVGFWAPNGTGGSTGDTWPSAWAADGTVFGWACDFSATPFTPMVLFNITGDPFQAAASGDGRGDGAVPGALTPELVAWDPIDYKTLCAPYGPTGQFPNVNTKPAGMLALPADPSASNNASVLYLGVSCINYGTDLAFTRQTNLGGFLVSSTDSGRTWTNVTAVGAFPGRFGAPVLVSCGRANDACDAIDGGALYVFFPGSYNDQSFWSNNDAMFLARTTRAHIAAPAQYQYYAGLDGNGEPMWNTDARVAQPVLAYGSMVGDNAVSYNPFIGRYVMGNFGFLDETGRPRPWHSKPFMSPHRTQLLVLEAPKPWGPWSVAYRSDDSPQAPGLYTPTFPSAYMRPLVPGPAPGTATAEMVMFFSCLMGSPACRYTLNYQIVTLTVNATAGVLVLPATPAAASAAPAPAPAYAYAAAATATGLEDDLACYYNGRWDPATSSCSCLPGWAPPDCRLLALLPAPPLAAATQTYYHPSDDVAGGGFTDNSWGIRMLPGDGDGLLHGFMTELGGNCSLSTYGESSRILHVTAPAAAGKGVAGPWSVAGVALEHFAHNPAVVRDVDGAWLLYHIGNDLPTCTISCGPGGKPTTNGTCSGASHGTSVARATSPDGPWERVPYILPDNETNPSPVVLPNGTIVLTARRWTGDVPVYVSVTGWRGPYVKQVLPLTTLPQLRPEVAVRWAAAAGFSGGGGEGDEEDEGPFASDISVSSNTTFFDEDPHLYVNALGYAHMITHRQPSGTHCAPTGPTPDDCRCAGGHLMAPTLFGPWYADPLSLFNCTLQVAAARAEGDADEGVATEGSEGGAAAPLQLHARQRPYLYFPGGSANASSCPLLFTGASTDPSSQYYSSFTMVQGLAC